MIQLRVSSVGKTSKAMKKFVADEIDLFTDDLLKNLKSNRPAKPGTGKTPFKSGRASRGWNKQNNTVKNTVPYINRLEEGYSRQQAPRGFVKQSINKTIRQSQRRNK